MGTHVAQQNPEEVQGGAADYMNLICQLLDGNHCDWRFILNMDQTPVYFLMCPKKKLKIVGVSMIHICLLTSNTKRAKVAVKIAANSTLLPLVIVFKGKAYGCIAKTEFATYPPNHQYCQDAT